MTRKKNANTSRPDGAIDSELEWLDAYPRKHKTPPPMKKKMSKEMQEFYAKHRDYFAEQGAEGGKTRAKHLTAKQRKQIAKKAAATRWGKRAK